MAATCLVPPGLPACEEILDLPDALGLFFARQPDCPKVLGEQALEMFVAIRCDQKNAVPSDGVAVDGARIHRVEKTAGPSRTAGEERLRHLTQVALQPGVEGEEGGGDLFSGIAPQGCYCLLYTSPSPRDKRQSRMPSSA